MIVSCVFALQTPHLRLNEGSFNFAKELIGQGRVVWDQRSDWGGSQALPEEENRFIHDRGFEEYAKWHLGIDERHGYNTKARYKFPLGDFACVRRSALLAIKNRARQYGYGDIEDAANQLLRMIESKPNDQGLRDPAAEPSLSHMLRNDAISSGNSSL